MIRASQLLITFSVFVCSLAAQVNERDLRRSYPTAADGNFVVGAGVELKGVFDKRGRACTLTLLHGYISEDQVLRLFDMLVPANRRGMKKQHFIDCGGLREQAIIYENVTLVTGAVLHQRSEPAAIITFSRADCKTAVAEAYKTRMMIQR